MTQTGSGTATLAAGPEPGKTTIGASTQQEYSYVYTAISSGSITFRARVESRESGSETAFWAESLESSEIVIIDLIRLDVQVAASLSMVTVPGLIGVVVTVVNNGNLKAQSVVPELTLSDNNLAAHAQGPLPVGAHIEAGSSQSFVFRYTSQQAGSLIFSATAITSTENYTSPESSSSAVIISE